MSFAFKCGTNVTGADCSLKVPHTGSRQTMGVGQPVGANIGGDYISLGFTK